VGRDYKEALTRIISALSTTSSGSVSGQKRLVQTADQPHHGNRTLPLLVSLNVLRDDKGKSHGVVAVLEDLSDIEKTQRMAAWRGGGEADCS